MTSSRITESTGEEAALAWLESLGYSVLHGPDISAGGDTLTPALSQRERETYGQVVLEARVRQALLRLNPDLPSEALDDAYRKLTRPERPGLACRIHERFCSNRGFAAATSRHATERHAGGQARPSWSQRTVARTPRLLRAPRARLA
jgi:hypothetical protein